MSLLPNLETVLGWLESFAASPEQKALDGTARAGIMMLKDIKDRPSVKAFWAELQKLAAIEATNMTSALPTSVEVPELPPAPARQSPGSFFNDPRNR